MGAATEPGTQTGVSPLRIGLRQFTPRDQRLRRNASNLQRAAESADGMHTQIVSEVELVASRDRR